MRRRLSLLIAFIGVLGLIGFAPTAEASHDLVKKGGDASEGTHEDLPNPPDVLDKTLIGDCVVTGNVNVGNKSGSGGVGIDQKSHNHYRFVDTNILCASDDPNYQGLIQVDAAGGTDGTNEDAMGAPTDNHGEDTANGWSHSSCYDDGNTTKAPDGCDPPANLPGDGAGPKPEPGGNDDCDDDGTDDDVDNDGRCDIDDLYDGTNTMGAPNDCNNCGEIEVALVDGDTASCTPGSRFDQNVVGGNHQCQNSAAKNVVMFCRGLHDGGGDPGPDCVGSTDGANVIAWGALHGTSDNKKDEVLCFLADLAFTPFNGDGGVTKKFDQAVLEGTAVLWNADQGEKEDCFGDLKGKKKESPA